ncbi:DUF4097 family beta strand repeat-containing protein [Micromonospora olivasterospora]|uniref:Putative adhesin n=1 Tax=Micromonospora olivasterospora TaxID=1880 RepID=A0A562I5I9_MICOL|nr:DUF4097 family beta strand repeat-containing protein [Micromonospora olivasterospora]TWH66028.1 putative adhesin [Micromonospora olivasterospora]
MALHRALPVGSLAAGIAALMVLSGCDNLSFRRLDFDTTEAATIRRVTLLPGGAGDVTVHGSGSAGEVRIRRVVRYQGDQPPARYEIRGDELVLDSDCGRRCTVSYDLTVPAGVTVRGEGGSGNVNLTRVGTVDVRVGSGDVRVGGATGAVRVETGSGNVDVEDLRGAVILRTGSGDVTGRGIAGQVDAEAGSGNVTVELSAPASARAHASSGDVRLTVPAGRYRVRAGGSGHPELGVTDDPTASMVIDVGAESGNVTVTAR